MRVLPLVFLLFGTSLGHDDLIEEIGEDHHHRELQATSCGRNSKFVAKVLIEHKINHDPNSISEKELEMLKTSAVSAFNDLNDLSSGGNTCDNSLRRYAYYVQSIEPKDIYFAEDSKLAQRDFLYTFVLTGVNMLSTEDPTMFDFAPSTERRELFLSYWRVQPTTVYTKEYPIAEVPVVDSSCSCPEKSQDLGTTEEEFELVFNKYIEGMRSNGRLDNIGSVVHATEMEQVSCTLDGTFEADVEVDVQGGNVNKGEFAIEFEDTYNDLTKVFCDPCFRMITEVQVSSRRRVRGRNLEEGTRLFTTATGKCRKRAKCQNKLFDDGGGRRRGLLPLVPRNEGSKGRRLDTDGKCYCPTNPAEYRAPSKDEFAAALDQVTEFTSDIHVVEVAQT